MPLTFGANPGNELFVLGVVREQVGVREIAGLSPDGDVRWYLRPVWRTWYRIGGVLMLVAAIGLTQAL